MPAATKNGPPLLEPMPENVKDALGKSKLAADFSIADEVARMRTDVAKLRVDVNNLALEFRSVKAFLAKMSAWLKLAVNRPWDPDVVARAEEELRF